MAVIAAALAVAVLVAYLVLIGQQGDLPAWWFVLALVLGAAAAAYGSARAAPRRRVVLLLGGVVLLPVGVLGMLTVGAPVLVAGMLCLATAARDRGHTQP